MWNETSEWAELLKLDHHLISKLGTYLPKSLLFEPILPNFLKYYSKIDIFLSKN